MTRKIRHTLLLVCRISFLCVCVSVLVDGPDPHEHTLLDCALEGLTDGMSGSPVIRMTFFITT